jgi:hypothetical protein
MKILNFIIRIAIPAILLTSFSCDSNKIDPTKIKGKWKTISNVKNSEIFFTIADSTILTEFYWDNGIKKVMYEYKIKEKKRNYLLVESKNTFGLTGIDTFVMENSNLRINTNIGKTLILEKIK